MRETPSPHGRVSRAARLLTNARRSVDQLVSLEDLTPTTIEEAYAIADAHAEQLEWTTVGWKVGCTSDKARKILNSPGPFAGRIFDGTVYPPYLSKPLHSNAMHEPGLECEFAFFLGDDLPPTTNTYSVADVKAATTAVAPAIELVSPRFTDFTGVGYLSLIADSGANGGVVLGELVKTKSCPELSSVTVELELDGAVVANGDGSAILGDPWASLQWLANHLSDREIGLHAGEFVLSGTCTGITSLPTESAAVARHEGLGSCEIRRGQGRR